MRFRSALFLSSALLAVAFCGTARAVTYDTPALSVLEEGQGVVALHVTAGSSGAPAGFIVQWMSRADYDQLGGWPADGTSTAVSSAYFRGAPTLNTADNTNTFILSPGQAARVEIGDLFDETGVGSVNRTELQANSEYVFRVLAQGNYYADASDPSSIQSTRTLPQGGANCTYTQGYWKNHPNAWPVSSLTLGTVSYTKTQLLQIFNQPAAGNGLLSLAHQLIAAKLNVAQGASLPGSVLTAITNADALIGNKVAPPIGAGSLSPGSSSALTQTLDDYNNGITGPGHCGVVPVQATTWSLLKLLK